MTIRTARTALLLALAATPAAAAAQQTRCPEGTEFNGAFCERRFEVPTWAGQFTALASNALLGGIAAGIAQEIRGGDFRVGFARGALGGAVVYVGKRLAVQPFDGSGLLGREVGAVGASMVRNAADGRGTFERLVLPVGPLRLYVRTGAAPSVRAKLDLVSAAWIGYAIVEPELELSWRESVNAGAPVFRTTGRLLKASGDSLAVIAGGVEAAGVILVSRVPEYGDDFTRLSITHERVHVLQDDHLFLVVNDPAEDWLFRRIPGGRTIDRYFDFTMTNQLRALVGRLVDDRENQPWEIEAEYLQRHR